MHQYLSFPGAFKVNAIVGGAERFELSIGQGRIHDQGAGQCFCFDRKKSTHSPMLPRLIGCRGQIPYLATVTCGRVSGLDSHLAFDHQELLENSLHDLVWWILARDAHEVGGNFEGVDLAL